MFYMGRCSIYIPSFLQLELKLKSRPRDYSFPPSRTAIAPSSYFIITIKIIIIIITISKVYNLNGLSRFQTFFSSCLFYLNIFFCACSFKMEGEKFAFFFFRLYAICSFINIDQLIRREKKNK